MSITQIVALFVRVLEDVSGSSVVDQASSQKSIAIDEYTIIDMFICLSSDAVSVLEVYVVRRGCSIEGFVMKADAKKHAIIEFALKMAHCAGGERVKSQVSKWKSKAMLSHALDSINR